MKFLHTKAGGDFFSPSGFYFITTCVIRFGLRNVLNPVMTNPNGWANTSEKAFPDAHKGILSESTN